MSRGTPGADRFWWRPFGQVAEIDARTLHARLQIPQAPTLLDVRSRLEWQRSHIEGSINVPIGELRLALPDLTLPKGQPIVAICLSAHRSIPAVRVLVASGHADAVQLRGGMLAWWRAGLPTRKAQ